MKKLALAVAAVLTLLSLAGCGTGVGKGSRRLSLPRGSCRTGRRGEEREKERQAWGSGEFVQRLLAGQRRGRGMIL